MSQRLPFEYPGIFTFLIEAARKKRRDGPAKKRLRINGEEPRDEDEKRTRDTRVFEFEEDAQRKTKATGERNSWRTIKGKEKEEEERKDM